MKPSLTTKSLLAFLLTALLTLPALTQTGYTYRFFPGGWLVKFDWPGYQSFGLYAYGQDYGYDDNGQILNVYWYPEEDDEAAHLDMLIVGKDGSYLRLKLNKDGAMGLQEGLNHVLPLPKVEVAK